MPGAGTADNMAPRKAATCGAPGVADLAVVRPKRPQADQRIAAVAPAAVAFVLVERLATHHDRADAVEDLLQQGPIFIGHRTGHPVVQHPRTVAERVLAAVVRAGRIHGGSLIRQLPGSPPLRDAMLPVSLAVYGPGRFDTEVEALTAGPVKEMTWHRDSFDGVPNCSWTSTN
jgi:hypothetical protein